MKILVLCPFGSTEPFGRENLEKISRPGTQFDYECVTEVFPLPYNTFPYNMLKVINAAVERIILAEQQGYDAVVNSCVSDPGLLEMRSVVDIPVTGCFESATHLAATMGAKWSVVTVEEVVAKLMNSPVKEAKVSDSGYGKLTTREQEIMRLLAEGVPKAEIADQLCISIKTVENHRTNIMRKLGIHTSVELVHYAVRLGLISLPTPER